MHLVKTQFSSEDKLGYELAERVFEDRETAKKLCREEFLYTPYVEILTQKIYILQLHLFSLKRTSEVDTVAKKLDDYVKYINSEHSLLDSLKNGTIYEDVLWNLKDALQTYESVIVNNDFDKLMTDPHFVKLFEMYNSNYLDARKIIQHFVNLTTVRYVADYHKTLTNSLA